MGTPDFSVPVLRRLIEDGYDVVGAVTQPDRPVGRKRILTPPPVKAEAQQHGIPVFQPEKIRRPEEVEKVLALQPDIIVTAAFGQILPKAILDTPVHGCVNVHASLLPELRGGAPIHYAIMQGKKKTGITIMYMAEKLDAGDIISQAECPIEESDDVGTMHDKLSILGAELLSETLPRLLDGGIKAVPQDDSLATFAPNIKREQEQIDWSLGGEAVYNKIRGLRPWPVAYTMWNGAIMKIWHAETCKAAASEPGTVMKVEKDGFVVATGNETAIKVTELQPAGKKKMSAEQFLRGNGSNFVPGIRLGEDHVL